jgi:hypothetical protein
MEGAISARIDSHGKVRSSAPVLVPRLTSSQVLYARTIDQRSATFDKALQVFFFSFFGIPSFSRRFLTRYAQMGEEYRRNTKAMLLRMNCVKHDFYVKPRMGEEEHPAKRT